jgi:hypothetical protein
MDSDTRASSDKRLRIVLAQIREVVLRGSTALLSWVPTWMMLADVLTKFAVAGAAVRAAMGSRSIKLAPPPDKKLATIVFSSLYGQGKALITDYEDQIKSTDQEPSNFLFTIIFTAVVVTVGITYLYRFLGIVTVFDRTEPDEEPEHDTNADALARADLALRRSLGELDSMRRTGRVLPSEESLQSAHDQLTQLRLAEERVAVYEERAEEAERRARDRAATAVRDPVSVAPDGTAHPQEELIRATGEIGDWRGRAEMFEQREFVLRERLRRNVAERRLAEGQRSEIIDEYTEQIQREGRLLAEVDEARRDIDRLQRGRAAQEQFRRDVDAGRPTSARPPTPPIPARPTAPIYVPEPQDEPMPAARVSPVRRAVPTARNRPAPPSPGGSSVHSESGRRGRTPDAPAHELEQCIINGHDTWAQRNYYACWMTCRLCKKHVSFKPGDTSWRRHERMALRPASYYDSLVATRSR